MSICRHMLLLCPAAAPAVAANTAGQIVSADFVSHGLATLVGVDGFFSQLGCRGLLTVGTAGDEAICAT
jgi:hypothetical protein